MLLRIKIRVTGVVKKLDFSISRRYIPETARAGA